MIYEGKRRQYSAPAPREDLARPAINNQITLVDQCTYMLSHTPAASTLNKPGKVPLWNGVPLRLTT